TIMRSPLLLSLIIGVASSVLSVSIPNSPFLAAETTTPNQRLLNQPQQVSPQVALTLERTACFGFCPIYKLTVYGNGKVVYEGKRFVKVTGTRTTTISKTAARKLIADFQKLNYFKLQDSYTGGHTDAPSAITSLTIGKKQKTVHHYLPSPDAPTQLTELENKIDTVVNSKQWIGTDAERAPRGTTK
ncbi:hypothetical protein H6F50_24375, partial [Coleofasciculus sp. FACHB-712]|uniref:DUF6438 domain-containing protein n=1 Tax=Coleofasciculus sp. FACHB-712 TaxID=2692789 RepID=UPI0018EFF69D